MKRRDFLATTLSIAAASPFIQSCRTARSGKKLLILGIDGMDPGIVDRMIKQGKLPNLQKLGERGAFTMMRSTIPPQSPVAWGSFITGADPGIHGIFDFVHRDPETYFPTFSLSEHTQPRWVVRLGKYRLPLKPGKMNLKRHGIPFWSVLEEHDIPATMIKIPSNFPPSESRQRTLSGMGIPDLMGGYGIYTLYTSHDAEYQKDLSPHRVQYAYIQDNGVMEGLIEGPANELIREGDASTIPFVAYIDRSNRTMRIDIQKQQILLSEKEYSKWVEIEFPLLGSLQSLKGMVKFYWLEMEPHFRLYISPVHINPRSPALPIATPSSFSRELTERCGLFHTLGLPADFNAIKSGTFSVENYIVQSNSIFSESERLFFSELERFHDRKQGLFFFYFSSLDQGQHIFWALTDPLHPFYQEKESQRFSFITQEYYQRCDRIVGETLKKITPQTEILVMSDHGFAPFYREVNLNTWLRQEGYLHLQGDALEGNVAVEGDWSRTRAYGMGLNGLYINLRGREASGMVSASEKRKLCEELKARLEQMTDPESGEKVVSTAYISEDHYSPDCRQAAPDLIIGFNRGYRSGDSFGEGGVSTKVLSPNLNWWSGDHCIDPKKVPATFISTFPIRNPIPHIRDIAPTILNYFGLPLPGSMNGKSII